MMNVSLLNPLYVSGATKKAHLDCVVVNICGHYTLFVFYMIIDNLKASFTITSATSSCTSANRTVYKFLLRTSCI